MRAGNTYRGARRNEAKERGLVWRFLDLVVLATGERRVVYPFKKNGKVISDQKPGEIPETA